MDAPNPRSQVELQRWLDATSIGALVLTVARAAFVAASKAIAGYGPVPLAAELTPWARDFFDERDGAELTVCTIGLPLLGVLVATLVWRLPPLSRRWSSLLHALGLVSGVRLLLMVRTGQLEAPSVVRLAVVAALALVLAGWAKISPKAPRWARLALLWALGGVLTWLVMASIVPASVMDHAYFYAPAREWLQGARLGTFYVQYNLLTLLLFAGMVKAGLWVHQAQVVLAAATAAWLGLYWLVARELMRRPSLRVLFVLAVFLFRFVAIDGHPSVLPQVTVLRLDLWVPLLLAAARFGLSTPKTAVAFALGWLADETFGLLFAAVFVAAVGVGAVVQPSRRSLRHLGPVLAPLAVAAVLRVTLLGGLLPVAAQRYASLRLGFLPISPTSLVWPLLAVLLAAVALGTTHRDDPRARLGLFACTLVGAQLVYFFGRSHEHNLFNLAGAWLLPLFLVLDHLHEAAPRAAVTGAAAVLLAGVAFVPWGRVDSKRSAVRRHWNARTLLEPNPIEETVSRLEAHFGRGRDDVVLLDMADGYLNFRLGYPQRGPVAPFQALLTLADASDFVTRALESGAVVACVDPACPAWVKELDSPALVTTRGFRLGVEPDEGGWTVRRIAP